MGLRDSKHPESEPQPQHGGLPDSHQAKNPQTENAPPSPMLGINPGSPIAQLFDRVRETRDIHASAEALVNGVADLLGQIDPNDRSKIAETIQHLRSNTQQWGGAILANTPLGQVPNVNAKAAGSV